MYVGDVNDMHFTGYRNVCAKLKRRACRNPRNADGPT